MENLKRYAYLIGAISLYSLKVTIFKVLKEKNKVLFNPCNVLCASQAIGLISSVIFLRRDLTSEKLKTIPTNIWKWMLLGTILSSIVGLYLSTLGYASETSVATISVLQRAQSVFIIIAEPVLSCFTKASLPSRWNGVNAMITAAGIIMTLVSAALFFGGTAGVKEGELYILLSSVCFTGSLIISKNYLSKVPAGILTVFRLTLGTIAFHLIALGRGSAEYSTLWTGELWLHMMYYGLFFVTVPQQCWLQATILCDKPLLSTGLNLNFVIQIIFAMIILQTFPTGPVLVGGSFILVSIVSSIIQLNCFSQNKNTLDGDEDDDEEEVEQEQYQMLDGLDEEDE